MKDAIENVLNLVVKPKYPLVDKIVVREDNDFDYTTYMIYIISDKYEALSYENDIVKDITNNSKTEARRLLKANAVKINGEKVDETFIVKSGDIIKVGKRFFGKIV